jgi:hypothetical protein
MRPHHRSPVRLGDADSVLYAGVSETLLGRAVLWGERGGNIFVTFSRSEGRRGKDWGTASGGVGGLRGIGGGDAIGEALRGVSRR